MKYLSILIVMAALSSCGSDQTDPSSKCTAQELYDQVTDKCVMRIREIPTADTGKDLTDTSKPVVDMGGEKDADMGKVDMGKECDKDHDGELSKECGGNDCDDNVRQMSPKFREVCDDLDNNCDGIINNGIDCSFYAHTGATKTQVPELYKVDPFLMIAKSQGKIILPKKKTLLDIDTHPNGILYGVDSDTLYKFDPDEQKESRRWKTVGRFGKKIKGANGMAIDSEGTAFVTAGDTVYTVDLNDGKATELGKVGGDFFSSGDCVVNKQDTLYMTSKVRDENIKDKLVSIDRKTGVATNIGDTGYKRVYGLVAGWGELFGLTAGTFEEPNGELIRIDPNTGKGELLHTFEGIRWYGSASDPQR